MRRKESDIMSEDKRRWGDRRDAKLLRDIDSLHFIMGVIYPNRADNEAYIAERIDLGPIKEYLEKKMEAYGKDSRRLVIKEIINELFGE